MRAHLEGQGEALPASDRETCPRGCDGLVTQAVIAKLSQAPAHLSGAELALFLENSDHHHTPTHIRNSTISMKEWL